jgi:broad specificity phosphatase PhoE
LPVQPSCFDKVVLARHGETEWNVAGRRQGQLDSPLTEAGLGQARALARALSTLAIDAIFVSPLGRAVATAEVCAQWLALPVRTLDELAELDHGAMAGLTSAQIERRYPGELGRRANDKYEWRFPGGESYADADRRCTTALARIAAFGSRSPVLISHEMIGRMLMRQLLGADPMTALKWQHPHDVIYRVDVARREVTELRV